MRCQVVSLQEKPWCTSFRRHVNKHSEEESKFIWLTFGICKVGLKFLENETFESYTLCHLQELARGALKQCRETWASCLPFLSTWRSAAALADPTLWGAAWESSTILALVDWGLLHCRMARTAMTQTTRWTDRSLQLPKSGNVAAVCRCGTLLSWPSMLEAALDPPCWVHPVLQGDANDQGEDPGAKLHLAELEG